METTITVKLRSRDDFRAEIVGGLLTRLQSIATVVPAVPDVGDEQLAVTVTIGSVDQVRDVIRAAEHWVLEGMHPFETVERIVVVVRPSGRFTAMARSLDRIERVVLRGGYLRPDLRPDNVGVEFGHTEVG